MLSLMQRWTEGALMLLSAHVMSDQQASQKPQRAPQGLLEHDFGPLYLRSDVTGA